MGADQFHTISDGATVGEAFDAAADKALWEHGQGGYTGTIAEKDGYAVVPLPNGLTAEEFAGLVVAAWQDDGPLVAMVGDRQAKRLLDLYGDKWGPAIAVDYGHGSWLFFGLASS